MNRRNFLRIAGGGVVVAAGGAGLFAATRTPQDALAPWRLIGSYDDPRKNALSHAILAPNPHNRQAAHHSLCRGGIAMIAAQCQ